MSRSTKEWIGKTDDSRPPNYVRVRVFQEHGGKCHIAGRKIEEGEPWDLDHVVALINGGENRESNLAPALRDKHREKTKADVAEKSKVYHKTGKNIGLSFRKGRPMPGSKASGFKKLMNGTVERRT